MEEDPQHEQLSTEQIHSLIDNVDIPLCGPRSLFSSKSSTSSCNNNNDIQETPYVSLSANDTPKSVEPIELCKLPAPRSPPTIITQTQTNQVPSTKELPIIRERSRPCKINVPCSILSSNTTTSTTTNITSPPVTPPKQQQLSNSSSNTQPATNPTTPTTIPSKFATSGRWSNSEHEAFLEGLKIYGREWKKVAQQIPTRTSAQIRSHAQKYFAKMARDEQHQASMWLSSNSSSSAGAGASVGEDASGIAHDGNALPLSPSLSSPAATAIVPGLTGRIGFDDKSLPPSVLERVDKILRDPISAQLEVEETMRRLRDRYNQLQKRVREKQDAKIAAEERRAAAASAPALPRHGSHFIKELLINNQSRNRNEQQPRHNTQDGRGMTPMIEIQHSQRNVVLDEAKEDEGLYAQENDHHDQTATTQRRLRDDLLASKELIALTVLGGELYRSGSKENLSAVNYQCENNAPTSEDAGTSNSNHGNQDDSKSESNDEDGVEKHTEKKN